MEAKAASYVSTPHLGNDGRLNTTSGTGRTGQLTPLLIPTSKDGLSVLSRG